MMLGMICLEFEMFEMLWGDELLVRVTRAVEGVM